MGVSPKKVYYPIVDRHRTHSALLAIFARRAECRTISNALLKCKDITTTYGFFFFQIIGQLQ